MRAKLSGGIVGAMLVCERRLSGAADLTGQLPVARRKRAHKGFSKLPMDALTVVDRSAWIVAERACGNRSLATRASKSLAFLWKISAQLGCERGAGTIARPTTPLRPHVRWSGSQPREVGVA